MIDAKTKKLRVVLIKESTLQAIGHLNSDEEKQDMLSPFG